MKCPVNFPGSIFQHVGSSFVGVPHPKDIDFLGFVPKARYPDLILKLMCDGYTLDNHTLYTDGSFVSYRKDNINLIITSDPIWYQNFRKAAFVCKSLKVFDKQQRIYIHDMFLKEEDDLSKDFSYVDTLFTEQMEIPF